MGRGCVRGSSKKSGCWRNTSWIPPINLRYQLMISRTSMFSVSVSFLFPFYIATLKYTHKNDKNKILKERGCWCYSHFYFFVPCFTLAFFNFCLFNYISFSHHTIILFLFHFSYICVCVCCGIYEECMEMGLAKVKNFLSLSYI